MKPILMGWLLLIMLIPSAWGAPPGDSAEALGPPWFRQALIYYYNFDGPAPMMNTAGLETSGVPTGGAPAGLVGRAFPAGATLTLRGPALSAHKPRTLSFWWAMPQDLPIDGGFSLFTLSGKGIISAFCRGKGDWCALQRPAGVAQVYYFAGIQNVNDIYDGDLMAHVNLHQGVWHHTAVVFRRASLVEVYTDGRLVTTITTSGREWSPADQLNTLQLGGGVLLDEVAVLDRAVDSDFISDYYRGVAHLYADDAR